MVYLSCRVAIETVLQDERRRRYLEKPVVDLMEKVYYYGNQKIVLKSFTNHTIKETLFIG